MILFELKTAQDLKGQEEEAKGPSFTAKRQWGSQAGSMFAKFRFLASFDTVPGRKSCLA